MSDPFDRGGEITHMHKPSDRPSTERAREDERVAQMFHEAYERLAPSFEYETREASAKPWADVPEPNRSLMIAVAGEVRDALASALEDAEQQLTQAHANIDQLLAAGKRDEGQRERAEDAERDNERLAARVSELEAL